MPAADAADRSATAPRYGQGWRKWGYLLSLLPPTLPLASYGLGLRSGHWDLAAFLTPVVYFLVIPVLDWLIGEDTSNPPEAEQRRLLQDRYYRLLTLACLPIYAAVLLFGAWVLANAPLSLIGAAGWVLSIGLVGGVTAINTAHELIHKPGRLERWAGGALLASVGYGSFRVEHIHGHHVDVATAADLSSARLGETIYRFVPRSIWRNPQRALELERAARAQRGLPWRPLTSELAGWTALSALFALACMAVTALSPPTSPAASDAAAAWWPGLVYFLGQGLVAISLLEIINYVEHYGLVREVVAREAATVRYERVNVRHSWNADFVLTNLLLFQLQRHSDHHAHPGRRYQALRHFEESPRLPAGYAAMVVLAAIPPLWRRVMDPRVAACRTPPADSLSAADPSGR